MQRVAAIVIFVTAWSAVAYGQSERLGFGRSPFAPSAEELQEKQIATMREEAFWTRVTIGGSAAAILLAAVIWRRPAKR